MSQNVNGRESGGWVRLAEDVGGAEFGNNAVVLLRADAIDSCKSHSDIAPAAVFGREKIQSVNEFALAIVGRIIDYFRRYVLQNI